MSVVIIKWGGPCPPAKGLDHGVHWIRPSSLWLPDWAGRPSKTRRHGHPRCGARRRRRLLCIIFKIAISKSVPAVGAVNAVCDENAAGALGDASTVVDLGGNCCEHWHLQWVLWGANLVR